MSGWDGNYFPVEIQFRTMSHGFFWASMETSYFPIRKKRADKEQLKDEIKRICEYASRKSKDDLKQYK